MLSFLSLRFIELLASKLYFVNKFASEFKTHRSSPMCMMFNSVRKA